MNDGLQLVGSSNTDCAVRVSLSHLARRIDNNPEVALAHHDGSRTGSPVDLPVSRLCNASRNNQKRGVSFLDIVTENK